MDLNPVIDINPYRYRSYYYDPEIQMYYLQSRYYDPEIGRFVNGDDVFFAAFATGSLSHDLYSYCNNDAIGKTDAYGFAPTNGDQYTYDGITCTKTDVGFSVNTHYKFAIKTFCKTYAKKVISKWGKSGKYRTMNAHRIAVELFAHEILFLLGIVLGLYSITTQTFMSMQKAKRYLAKISNTVSGILAGRVSKYLIEHANPIDVNYNEPWYREVAFEVIWAFFTPYIW